MLKYYKESKGLVVHDMMILTARGRPRMAKTTKEAVLIASFPPTMLSLFLDSPREIKVIMAVPAMQANTIKLLTAHTDFEPIH